MKHRSFSTVFVPLTTIALLCTSGTAVAGATDIANAPIASSSSTAVKPNLMFVLDDSGSMSWTFLPDTAANFLGKYGYLSSQCNGAYYNPNITYQPPVDATGASFLNASFTAARSNGFDSTSATTDLSSAFVANRFVPESANLDYKNVGSYLLSSLGPSAAYYYSYSGSQTTKTYSDSNSTFYKECNSSIGSPPGKNVFTKVTVSATSGPSGTSELQNFANWYSYYRTRMLTMKTAVGRAYKSIDDKYRVGYSTIGYTGTDSTSHNFLKITDFNVAQKTSWYAKLYSANPAGSTPLRGALSKAGRLYAGKLLTGSDDPVQYSCQQNFTILSTDGYWNSNGETSSYGPKQVNNSTSVGNQDGGSTLRPLLDGLNISDTLSDVSMYYYNTDLRSSTLSNCTGALGTDVCENNVPGSGVDVNVQQHMTTFTLGLGVSGELLYSEDYLSGGSADYNSITQGTKNWPKPVEGQQTTVDDLWHTAVNGRGTYFSAQNPDSLVSGLTKALAGVTARTGSGAGAATSTLQPVTGDNYVFSGLYRTVNWDGDLQAKTIDPNTGVISSTAVWSAQPLLDAKVSASSDTRTIYTFNSVTNGLKSFTWANLTAGEQNYFNNMCAATPLLSQCVDLTAAQKTAASGQNLVNFIRGQDGYEDQATNTDRLYRNREHVLGDMINSQPAYVKIPPFVYSDTNYSTFRDTTQKSRSPIVYVAANDGMLHAFDGASGTEQWAYIPPMVLPALYKLADKNYSTNHRYYVDGSPTIGDICPNAPGATCSGAQWKTVLIGGLNAGGRGYYALDVTNPASPQALWNFTVTEDADLGYTFGNPVITKRQDGTWIVVFTSGYNNISPGNGQGYLYVLNANTGALLEKIPTNTGDTTTPSGLAKINSWVDLRTNKTSKRFYGGDLLGNVWRFDIDNTTLPAGKEATLIAELGKVVGAGTQPVTTKPELTEIEAGGIKHVVVSVGTGRYLGLSDLTDTSQQSVYSFKDKLTATGLGQVRLPGVLVKQTLTTFTGISGQLMRTTSTNAVDWATQSGWYVDLNPNNESPGERVNVAMQQLPELLLVAGNVPNTNACTTGGYAWLYYFDYKTGQYVKTSPEGGAAVRWPTNAPLVDISPSIILTDGKPINFATDTTGKTTSFSPPPPSNTGTAAVKRMSWRELIN